MKTINSTLVTIDINGTTFDCLVSGYYYEAFAGGFHDESTDEEYDIQELDIVLSDGQVTAYQLLHVPAIKADIIEQLKAQQNET